MDFSIGTKIGDLKWPWTAQWPLFCVILSNSVALGANAPFLEIRLIISRIFDTIGGRLTSL